MPTELSKPLFNAFITAFTEHSKTLPRGRFTKTEIASVVLPGSDPGNAKSHFCAVYSVRGQRPLDEPTLINTIDTCRRLLRSQYQACDEPLPDAKASAFEKGVCKQLGMVEGDRIGIEDFRTDRRIELASSLADLGLPDILDWRQDQFGFAADSASVQKHSVALLQSLLPAISQANVDRRLRLLRFAVSIACLNHPGSKHHAKAVSLAAKAADLAGLQEILATTHRRKQIQFEALTISLHLKSSFFMTTLNSPTNYMRYLLRDRRMTAGVWTSIERHVDEAIIIAEAIVRMNPHCQRAVLGRAGTVTMKARLLAARGDSASLTEADRLYKRSRADEERLQVPYGFLYPIVRDLARGKPRLAIPKAERAVAAFQTAGNHAATRAFAALLVHLTERASTKMTSDRSLLALAHEAANSPAIQYQHSHVFDSDRLGTLLRARSRQAGH